MKYLHVFDLAINFYFCQEKCSLSKINQYVVLNTVYTSDQIVRDDVLYSHHPPPKNKLTYNLKHKLKLT